MLEICGPKNNLVANAPSATCLARPCRRSSCRNAANRLQSAKVSPNPRRTFANSSVRFIYRFLIYGLIFGARLFAERVIGPQWPDIRHSIPCTLHVCVCCQLSAINMPRDRTNARKKLYMVDCCSFYNNYRMNSTQQLLSFCLFSTNFQIIYKTLSFIYLY